MNATSTHDLGLTCLRCCMYLYMNVCVCVSMDDRKRKGDRERECVELASTHKHTVCAYTHQRAHTPVCWGDTMSHHERGISSTKPLGLQHLCIRWHAISQVFPLYFCFLISVYDLKKRQLFNNILLMYFFCIFLPTEGKCGQWEGSMMNHKTGAEDKTQVGEINTNVPKGFLVTF